MPVPCHQKPGPERDRTNEVGSALETSTERLRHHLRRPHASGGDQLNENATYTVYRILPKHSQTAARA